MELENFLADYRALIEKYGMLIEATYPYIQMVAIPSNKLSRLRGRPYELEEYLANIKKNSKVFYDS